MVGLTREIAAARSNRAFIKSNALINDIEKFIKAHAKDDSFMNDILVRYEQPVQEMIEQLISENKENKNDFEALLTLQSFWRLGYFIDRYSEKNPITDPFFCLVNCSDGMDYTFSFNKKELKEFEKTVETAFYKLFDNEPDDIPFSEYPLAIMLGRVDEDFNIIKKKAKIKKHPKK